MRTRFAQVAIGVIAVMCAAQLAPPAASATPGDADTLIGGGSISPGWTLTPNHQSGTFSGVVAGAAVSAPGAAVGVGTCNFSFSSTIGETNLQGAGVVNGGCSGGTIGSAITTCSGNYARVGLLFMIAGGTCTVAASSPTGSGVTSTVAILGVFQMLPTTAPGTPIVSYAMFGAFTTV